MDNANFIEPLLITIPEAARLCGVKSKNWIYEKEKEDLTFPRILRFGRRASRIRLAELKNWVGKQGNAD